jgi:GTPase SAR1 family protein
VRRLNYQFASRTVGGTSIVDEDQVKAREQILGHMVGSCERLSKDNGINVLAGFMKMFQSWAAALVSDDRLRRTRLIDRVFVQNLLAKNFPVQLNPQLLPREDALVRITQQDFPIQVEQAGYKGPFHWTTELAKVFQNQAAPNSKLSIPGSVIMIGKEGTGKTSLVLAFIKVLFGDQQNAIYNFDKPDNPEAKAFVLNCRKLFLNDDEITNDGDMTVSDALEHLEHFLTLPHGHRGLILLDDMHAPKEEVKARLLQKLQGLVGAEDKMWRGSSPIAEDKEIHEVPLRNLSLVVTVNPPANQREIAQFKEEQWQKPTTEQLILAALSTKEYKLDPSFLSRFASILRMDTFDAEAKVPAALSDVRSGAQEIFISLNKVVVVSPAAAELVRRNFPNMNARQFLTKVPRALLEAGTDFQHEDAVQIVVPKSTAVDLKPGEPVALSATSTFSGKDGSGDQIESFVQANIQAIPVSDSYEGRLELLRYSLSSYRNHLYELLIQSMWRDPRFSVNPELQHALMAPFLHAVKGHLEKNPGIGLKDLKLDARHLGAKDPAGRLIFERALEERSSVIEVGGFYPKWIFTPTRDSQSLSYLEGNRRFLEQVQSRRDILVQVEQRIRQLLEKFLQRMLQLKSVDVLPTPKDWLGALKEIDPNAIDEVGKDLSSVFLDLNRALHGQKLVEKTDGLSYSNLSTYDAARIFFLTLDRSIGYLPWGRLTFFLSNALQLSASDMTLGELPGVQSYLFKDPKSLMVPRTADLPIQLAVTSKVFENWDEDRPEKSLEKGERMAGNFISECERMFAKPGSSGGAK